MMRTIAGPQRLECLSLVGPARYCAIEGEAVADAR